ncbi:MAG: flavin reductase family protein [Thermoleophilia bacterium]|nr:flavin reductase family protein [Thermoleophilia bacterium]
MSSTQPPVSGLVPCSTVLLTASAYARQDAMTATAIFISEEPPILSVSVAKHILTHYLIGESGEFVANLAAGDQLELARQLGSTHGTEVDKIEHFNVPVEIGEKVAAPRIQGSYASLECRVLNSYDAGDFVVYFAEVLASSVDPSKVPLVWHQGRYYPLENPVA